MDREPAHTKPATARPLRVAVYCRISRDRFGAGLGVDRQEKECRELADRLGFTVAGVYRDNDLSAYSGKPRPEYLRMLADLEAGRADAVLAWHTDRLHRSPVELENYIAVCEKRGAPTHTVQAGPLDLSTPSGRLVARQLGAVARYEVEHTIERQKAAKLQLATAGKWGGGRRPYGYEADGVTIRETERAVVAHAIDSILMGASLRSLVALLNGRGILTATGVPWQPTELKRVLIRPRNAGLREHRGGIIGRAEWEPLVPEEKWRAVQATLSDPSRQTNRGRAPRWLLSGLARCGVCESGLIVMSVSVAARRNILPHVSSYTCNPAKHVVRKATELERYIEMVVVERLRRPDAINLLLPASPGVDLAALTAEETNLQQRLHAMADNLDLDEQLLARRSQRIRERLGEIAEQKAVEGRGSVLSGVVDAPDPGTAWEALDLDRKRSIIAMLMTLVVNPTRKGRPKGWQPGQSYFSPDGVLITWNAG